MKFRLVESIEPEDAENIITNELRDLWTKHKRQVNPKDRTISTTNVFVRIYQLEGEFWFKITYKRLPAEIIKELKATWAYGLSNQFALYWAESDPSKKVQKFKVELENIEGDDIRAIIQKPLQIQEYIRSIKRKGKA